MSGRTWWKDGTVYQIYPASFKDSNDDGLGDIPGILSEMDYIQDLGVDIIWLSPMYESPQHDMGYDISDYEAVYKPYGTVADVEALIAACHKRGMKLILDLVVNHTSYLHAWFQESKSSTDNPKHDWYIWRPARQGKDGERIPPNNWRSFFGGSAWEWDDNIGQYYLHLFEKRQPDLNWENEACRNAIYDSAMRFWLEKGVDGFRVDTVNMYSKGTEMPDAPITDPQVFEQPAFNFFCNGPRMHEFLREMNKKVLNNYDAVTVGELPHTEHADHVRRYVSASDKQLSMVFQFDLCDIGMGKPLKYDFTPWKLSKLKEYTTKWQEFIIGTDAWTTAFLENHDQGRSISRYASDSPEHRVASAKMLAIMLATMTGTLFVYQGQEIGMINAPRDWPIEEYIDVESSNHWNQVMKRRNGDKEALDRALSGIQILARDHARLPMQWNASANAGFSTAKPWMRTHDLYPEINVEKQKCDPDSVLSFWKRMIAMRKQYLNLFVHGDFEAFDMENEQTFVYSKAREHDCVIVALNFTDTPQSFKKPDKINGKLEVLVSSAHNVKSDDRLCPFEGRVCRVV